jgi:alcohol dehydrogenase, propanol-preferring
MILNAPRSRLQAVDLAVPIPTAEQVLIRVHTCGVCRTDLHIVDGELTQPKLPLIPGHQIVGTVVGFGTNVHDIFPLETRVGVLWLGHTCNCCGYCQSGRENLCDRAQFTGYQIDGGYAEYAVADARWIPRLASRTATLCWINWLSRTNDGERRAAYWFIWL